MNDPLNVLIREAIGDILDLAPTPVAATAGTNGTEHRPDRGRRTLVAAASALVAVLGVAGIVVAARQPKSLTSAKPSVVTATEPATSISASTTSASTTSASAIPQVEVTSAASPNVPGNGADPLAGTNGWYLPSYIPDGYEMVQLTAHPTSRAPASGHEWVRLDPDTGAVAAQLSTRAIGPQPGKSFDFNPTPGLTVHGFPAHASVEQLGVTVFWLEQGLFVEVVSHSLTEAETITAAEAVVVDAASTDATYPPDGIPLGFAVPTPNGSAPVGAVGSNIELMPLSGDGFAAVGITVDPNFDGVTLDSFADATSEHHTVGDVDILINRQVTDSHGTGSYAVRLDGGMIITVMGRLSVDELATVTADIKTSTADDVVAAGQQITARTLTMPILDQATMADGTQLSVRTDGHGATALCVEAPFQHCKRQISESSLVGDSQDTILAVFDETGNNTVYGWHTGQQTPAFGPNNASPETSDTTTATITEAVSAATGTFIQVTLAPGEAPPSFQYGTRGYGVNLPSLVDY